MEAKKIEVVKDWPKPKSVYDIQVFLSIANFYRRFIQGFSRIAALLTSMLKITGSPNKPAPSKSNNSKSASSKNDDNRSIFGKNNGDGEVNGFGGDSMEHAKKLGKSKG